jgi:general secretion pathway protein N
LRVALILAAIIFVITLLVRLPASVLLAHLPADVVCDEASGTVWHGTCAQLRAQGVTIPGVTWTVHPWSLLSLTLNVDLSSADPSAGGSAQVELARNGDARIYELHFSLPVTPEMQLLPAGSSATIVLTLPFARVHAERLVAAEGTVDLQRLRLTNPPAELGSYQMQFQPSTGASDMIGQFHDLNGPLAVSGQMRLQPSGAFEINGTVAPRANASHDINQALQMLLGPPDAQGQRPFSLAGTL